MTALVLASATKTEAKVDTIGSRLKREEDLRMLDWLSPIDYGPIHSDTLKRRQAGTGQWLLESVEYQKWLVDEGITLFCPGIPGAGKTILTSVVIDDLVSRYSKDGKIGIAYIYCNFRRQNDQDFDHMLTTLLKQLCQQLPGLPEGVRALYGLHYAQRTRPSTNELQYVLSATISEYSRVFIILDALDECRISDNFRSMFLARILELQQQHNVNIFATSRFIPSICEQLSTSLQLEIRARKEDILTYLRHNMNPERFFLKSNENLQKEIREAIAEAAEGM